MPLSFRWVEDDERDRVGLTRMRSYAPAAKDLPRYLERVKSDPKIKAGDCLLAELDGEPVGTATSLSMTMWVRGGAVFTQGVAYVGTVRTHRRVTLPTTTGGEPLGVASQVMHEVLRKARDRGQAASALMPFRNSFYERFGYGVVERRNDWIIPTNLLPAGEIDGYRHYRPADLEALAASRQKQVCRGQCDLKRTKAAWEDVIRQTEEGFLLIDRPDPAGPVRGFIDFDTVVRPDGRWQMRVDEIGYQDIAALRRALSLIGSLKDQYAFCMLSLPIDLPVNRLLKETQVPHRITTHVAAECKTVTRLQVRILDHKAFLEAMTALPREAKGKTVVSVRETEGHESRFEIEIEAGRATVTPSEQTAQFDCNDTTWAGIACGDLSASQASAMGLASCKQPAALTVLDALSIGPASFCNERF